MDKPQLEGSFLTLCGNYTAGAMLLAATVILGALVIAAQPAVDRLPGDGNYFLSELNAGNFIDSAYDQTLCPNSTSSGSANKSASKAANIDEPMIAEVTDKGKVPAMYSGFDHHAQTLSVENITVHDVVFFNDGAEFNRVNIYFANCSQQAGLVQLRFAALNTGEESPAANHWKRRRVPRFDYLVYSVSLPNDLDPSTITLYLRAQPKGEVREFQLASYGIEPLIGRVPTGELYTQNHGG